MLNLIDHLPRHSYFVEALLNDPEYGERIANQPAAPAAGPRLSEWSPEVVMLADAIDALRVLSANYVGAHGAKPKFTPVVRPITAVDRARQARRRADHASLVARVLPGRHPT